jgi:hypothetical protein
MIVARTPESSDDRPLAAVTSDIAAVAGELAGAEREARDRPATDAANGTASRPEWESSTTSLPEPESRELSELIATLTKSELVSLLTALAAQASALRMVHEASACGAIALPQALAQHVGQALATMPEFLMV